MTEPSANPLGGAFPRRQFLKGAGAATGAFLAGLGAPARAEDPTGPAAPPVHGPDPTPMRVRVNGREHRVRLDPRTTLAELLTVHLGLRGTKVGCDRGACSACTVWLDGTPFNACMLLAIEVGEREVTTIEGLARPDALHPVQSCFVEKDALQCGYCTPGMVMSCAALLARNPSPTLDDVRTATSGNLCRCGTYPKVFEATLEAARRLGQQGEGR